MLEQDRKVLYYFASMSGFDRIQKSGSIALNDVIMSNDRQKWYTLFR